MFRPPMHTVPRSVRNWLIVVASMIFFMIVLGALTRLTESGLSMVECSDDDLDLFLLRSRSEVR